MLDIGFFEIIVVAVVLIVVMGPERLPEVVKQVAFFVRKAREGMFRLRSEMKTEMEGTPFADLQEAQREVADFKNDIKQFGRDIASSAEKHVEETKKTTSLMSKELENLQQQVESSDDKVGEASEDIPAKADTNSTEK